MFQVAVIEKFADFKWLGDHDGRSVVVESEVHANEVGAVLVTIVAEFKFRREHVD